jgi:DNA-binding IclR family transcriptional regulator
MIQVLHKACDALELLARRPERSVGLGEIARQLGLNASTCANILKTLIARGLVEQVAPRKGYRLGGTVYFLARGGPYRRDLVEVARPVVADLSAELGEMVLLTTLQHGKRFILCIVNPARAVQVRDDVPYLNDVCETATGRLLLAHEPPGEVDAFVAEHGVPGPAWPGAETAKALRTALTRIRYEGQCITVDRPEVGQVALPVFEGDSVVAALGVSVPLVRFDGEHRDEVITAARAAAERLGEKLTSRHRLSTAVVC